jgi:hypothetical protein
MSPEQSQVAPAPVVPPVPEHRTPDSRPVSRVDWFRNAPTGGTVYVSAD